MLVLERLIVYKVSQEEDQIACLIGHQRMTWRISQEDEYVSTAHLTQSVIASAHDVLQLLTCAPYRMEQRVDPDVVLT